VRADDVVLSVDGIAIDGQQDLQRIISSRPVGRTVTVMRDGAPTELVVTIGPCRGGSAAGAPRRALAPFAIARGLPG